MTRRLPPIQTFRALHYRGFRWLWLGLLISAVGTWMQIVALSFLVLDLTHGSAVALGIIALAQALSFFIFAPAGGRLADRFDRRRLLLVTQSALMALALLLGLLTAMHVIRFWTILAVAVTSSALLSFDQPARAALLPSLVPPADMMNAISLQTVIFNGASALGPALAGIALSRVSYAGIFFLNAASFLGVLAALAALDSPAGQNVAPVQDGLRDSVPLLLETVRRDAVLPFALAAYASMLFFGPSVALLLPLYATQVVTIDATRLGFLFSAVGVGTVAGALFVASLGDFAHKGWLLLVSLLIWSGALAGFGLSAGFGMALSALLVFGAAQNSVSATSITLLQTRVPPQMRGRVMGLNTVLVMGVRPLGDFLAAALIGLAGVRATTMISAVLVGSCAVWCLLLRPGARSA